MKITAETVTENGWAIGKATVKGLEVRLGSMVFLKGPAAIDENLELLPSSWNMFSNSKGCYELKAGDPYLFTASNAINLPEGVVASFTISNQLVESGAEISISNFVVDNPVKGLLKSSINLRVKNDILLGYLNFEDSREA